MRYRILLQEIFNAGKEFKDFQNKLRTGLVENYDAVYVERKNQNCLWLKGFIREMSKIQIKKYRFFCSNGKPLETEPAEFPAFSHIHTKKHQKFSLELL